MTGIVETLSAGAAAISIFDKLVEIVEASHSDEENPNISEIIHSLYGAAKSSAGQLSQATRELNIQLSQSGFNIGMNIDQIETDLCWYNFIRKSQLESVKTEFENLYRSLTKFIDDITSVLICTGNVKLLESVHHSARTQKKILDELINSERSIQEIVNVLMEISDDLNERLQNTSYSNKGPQLTL